MAPRAPPKRKKTKKRVFLVIGDPNGLPKKFSAIFGAGCRKVCMLLLTERRQLTHIFELHTHYPNFCPNFIIYW